MNKNPICGFWICNVHAYEFWRNFSTLHDGVPLFLDLYDVGCEKQKSLGSNFQDFLRGT